jgi:hypothetical protein
LFSKCAIALDVADAGVTVADAADIGGADGADCARFASVARAGWTSKGLAGNVEGPASCELDDIATSAHSERQQRIVAECEQQAGTCAKDNVKNGDNDSGPPGKCTKMRNLIQKQMQHITYTAQFLPEMRIIFAVAEGIDELRKRQIVAIVAIDFA